MAVSATERDAINTEDDHHNDSFGNPGLISPDREDIARLLKVPFSGRIRGGMRPGKKVIVMGIVDLEPDSFDVSLTCGRGTEKEEPQPDVALKLSARFAEHQFLRNSRVSGKWSEEEKSIDYFPFIPDQPFRVPVTLILTPNLTSPSGLRSTANTRASGYLWTEIRSLTFFTK
ncbi:galectin-related protein-like isoform X2 [Oncorhynchus keta]|uniref:galectin-related protein-like isoform X2 n=1 Tax=Oncorhynchus keta TaxID=8018 RepID=UPI002279F85F|nr:galectin-related protein-like isoform X2 [Oncorhynchus keta]